MSDARKQTLHTQIPDAEIDALRLSTDGADGSTALALLFGIRYAMRAAFRTDRVANPQPYGPTQLSHRDIAGASLCSVATVKRWLPLLERAGVLSICPVFNPKGDQLASKYALLKESSSVQNEPTPQLKMNEGVSSRFAERVSYLRRDIDTKDTSLTASPVEEGELFPNPQTTPKPRPQRPNRPTDKGPIQLRAEKLMRRRADTPLDNSEMKAFKAARPAIEATSEADWLALEAFHNAPQSQTYARKSLKTLLDNWNGEITAARAWQAKHATERIRIN